MTKTKTILVIFLFFPCFLSAEIIKSYGVDGSSNNVNVIINGRDPILFFEYNDEYILSSFEIKISSLPQGLTLGNTIWYIISSTSVENTINYTTRIEVNRQILSPGVTYYIAITAYETDGTSQTVNDMFYVSYSAVSEFKANIVLEIDYNNPFCPSQGEITKIRFKVDKDILVSVYVFSISGECVRLLREKQIALKDMVYTIDWDGRDNQGKILPQGVYLVVLYCGGINPVSKLVGIVDKR